MSTAAKRAKDRRDRRGAAAFAPRAAGRRRCGLRGPDRERKPSRRPKSLTSLAFCRPRLVNDDRRLLAGGELFENFFQILHSHNSPGCNRCEQFWQVAGTWGNEGALFTRNRFKGLALHLVGRHEEALTLLERVRTPRAPYVRAAHNVFHEYDDDGATTGRVARILWHQGFPVRAAEVACRDPGNA